MNSCSISLSGISAILLAFAAAANSPSAVAEDMSSFPEALRKIVEARSKISSYAVSITATVDDPASPVPLTNGTTAAPDRKHISYQLDVVTDTAKSRFLVARQDVYDDLTTKTRSTEEWTVFATTEQGRVGARKGRGFFTTSDEARDYVDNYFDPLALGFGLTAEFHRGTSWRTIAQNYSLYADRFTFTSLPDGIARYTSPFFQMDVDHQHGHWPVQMVLLPKSNGLTPFAVKIEISQVDGNWMPQSGTVKLSAGKVEQLKFHWSRVNSTVDDYFELERTQRQYGFVMSR